MPELHTTYNTIENDSGDKTNFTSQKAEQEMDDVQEDMEYDVDEEEAYWERFDAEAQNVYEIWWKEKRHHGRDREECDGVVKFDNQYFILRAYGEGPQGPYITLEKAILAGELNYVYEFTIQINAPTLSDESLEQILYYAGTLKHTLVINGNKWRTKAGRKLEPEPEDNR